ncbi:amino acid adenylation domain-containing protein [Streptomyces sp. CA2R106]|uniref:amino acid adenylation domain-containing protein n=1 Tax=Streptomyces sp. CA2R106 TaxID=3120153 RepID=UPI00300AD11B
MSSSHFPTGAADTSFVPSYAQESLWLLDSMSRNPTAYNETVAFRIDGPLHPEALEAALQQAVRRHEALRTVYTEGADGLRAVVLDEAPSPLLAVTDLTGQDAPAAEQRARELVDDAQNQPFDLAAGPLLRAVAALLPGGSALFALTVHHINADGWSLGVVLAEIGTAYRSLTGAGGTAEETADGPAGRYSDWARQLRAAYEDGAYADKVEYWKRSLAGGPELLKLPSDRPRPPVQSSGGGTVSTAVPQALVKGLTEQALRQTGATEFSVLLGAWAVLLHRYSGQDRVTVGTTVLNRTDADHLATVGYFTNTVAFGVDLADQALTFRGLLGQVGEAALDMMEFQDAPYPKVLESLNVDRTPSHSPVFQTMLTLLGRRRGLDLGPDTVVRPHPVTRTAAKFDLLLYVVEDEDTVELQLEYATDLFGADTARRILGHYTHLLGQLAADLDVEVREVPVLPDAERALILDEWNATARDYPDTTVPEQLDAQATATPDAVAVRFRDTSLTYGELRRRTNRVARALLDRDVRGGFVGVFMERSADMVVALLAVVKAGLAYVPIDPEYPADRIRYMLEDSGVPLVLTHEAHRAALADTAAEPVVLAELLAGAADDRDIPRALTPDSRAYMIYTSGSTGRPKGVVNRHGALFNRLHWMQQQYGLRADDRVLQKTPFSFDVSVWEFFWPLMYGAQLVVAEPGGHRDTEYLKEVIRERGITTLHFVPSMLNVFLEEDGLAEATASLRRVFCSGEALPHSAVAAFRARLAAELHNLYGPTEAAIDVSYWAADADYPGRVVPIGRPVANTRLYVVDQRMRLQPVGVPGELCIGGVQLAEGYHNRPDLTEKAFRPDPFTDAPGARLYRTGDLARYLPDGQLEYLGRIDNQVKLRGFRIELGEIEAVLQGLPTVRDAAVVVHENDGGSRALVAYVVPGEDFTQDGARAELGRHLPEFMVPQVFVEIAAVPLSANGKLDRRALPAPGGDVAAAAARTGAAVTPPSTPEEHALARVWREVLGHTQVGADSNFFQLGGDSILSIRIGVRLRELGYRVSVREIFEHPTVADLARHLTRTARDGAGREEAPAPFALVSPADRELLPEDTEDAWPLSRLQSGMLYHSMLHPDSPVYHDIFSYDLAAPLDADLLRQAVAGTAAAHPQLRSSFDLASFGEPLQLVHRGADLELEVSDAAGAAKAEQQAALARWTEREKARPFDIERAPLLRLHAQRRSADAFTLTLAFHHAVLDGWSVALVVEGIRRRYAALLAGERPETGREQLPYSAFVALEREAAADPEQAAFWAGRLEGAEPTLLSAKDGAGSGQAGPATGTASAERDLPAASVAALQGVARELGVPARTVFLGLHVHALGRVTGRGELLTGLVVNGRPEPDGEELAGLFLNTVPVRAATTADEWAELFAGIFRSEQELMARRRYPLADILGRVGRGELFDTVFNYTDFHVYRDAPQTPVRITGARYFEMTSFPFVVHVHRDHFADRASLIVNHDAAAVAEDTVTAYLEAYTEALASAAAGLRPGSPQQAGGGSGEVAERVAAVLDGALTGGPIGPDEDFFARGLDSISAIRVVARIKRQGLPVTLQDVFAHRTVRSLAAALAAGAGGVGGAGEVGGTGGSADRAPAGGTAAGPAAVALPPGAEDAYPATALQLEMIRRHDADPAQAVYHDVFAYRLAVPLREERLREVLDALVAAHPTLRTAFLTDARPVPLQVVHAPAPAWLEVHDPEPGDLAGADADARLEAWFDAWFEAEKASGFTWSRPELMRFHAHRQGPDAFTLTLSFHHSVIDGWSLSRLLADFVRLYTAAGPVPEPVRPPAGPRQYAAAEAAARADGQAREFWLAELRGVPAPGFPAPAADQGAAHGRWSEVAIEVDPETGRGLAALARSAGVPLKHVLLAAHLEVLRGLETQPDLLTAVFSGGRQEIEGAEDMIGMFLNFLPLHVRLDGRPQWPALAAHVFEAERRALPHRRFPVTELYTPGGPAVPRTAFNFTRFEAYGDLAADGTADGRRVLAGIRWFEHTHFALLANVGHDLRHQRLIVTLNADGRVLPPDAVRAIGRAWQDVLSGIAAESSAYDGS